MVCPAGWRVPTKEELQILISSGSEWITLNGVKGRLFGSGDNTVFLPAVNYRYNPFGDLIETAIAGYYWSGTQLNGITACRVKFDNSEISWNDYCLRENAMSVRCVATGPTSIPLIQHATMWIYPNPVNDGILNVNIVLPNNETAVLTIVNLQGQVVYNTVINNGFASINTHLATGVYIVSVQSESGLKKQKLIVK